LRFPASGQLSARGCTAAGYFNGDSGLIGTVASFGAQVISPPIINSESLKIFGDGSSQFSFGNPNNIAFNVVAATNVSQPASNWTVLGVATNIAGGLHQFTDSTATNFARRSYRLRFP
jgi:hypothetical protein